MTKQFSLLFISLITLQIYAKSEILNKDLVIYKNKNGFEVTHKKCQKLEALNSFERNKKDLSNLDNIIINVSCEKDGNRFVSIGPAGESFKSAEEIEKKYLEISNRVKRYSKMKGSSTFHVHDKKYLKDLNLLLIEVARIGMNSGYRWYIKKRCGIVIHALEVNAMIPHSKAYETKITSGEEILPPEEKKIIDSFKCVEQEKK